MPSVEPLKSVLFPPNSQPGIARASDPNRRVVLRGFNLSAHCKVDGYPFEPTPDVAARASQFLPQLAADGFDLLRIPLVWEYLQPDGPDAWNETLVEALQRLLDVAAQHGFYVLLDLHQDLLSSYFRDPARPTFHGDGLPKWALELAFEAGTGPAIVLTPDWKDQVLPTLRHWAQNYEQNEPLRRALRGVCSAAFQPVYRAWVEGVATRFASRPNVLAIDAFNEPHYGVQDAGGYQNLRETVVAAMLAKGVLDNNFFVCPAVSAMPAGNWLLDQNSNLGLPEIATDPTTIEQHSLITTGFAPRYWLSAMHLYDPAAGTGVPMDAGIGRYASTLQAVLQLYSGWGAVPLVGEFGVPSDRNANERRACHDRWIDLFESAGLSWCLWNFNPDSRDASGDDSWCGEKFSVAFTNTTFTRVTPTSAYYDLLRPFARRLGCQSQQTTWTRGANSWTWRLDLSTQGPLRPTDVTVPASLGPFSILAQSGLSVSQNTARELVLTPQQASASVTLGGGPVKAWL